MGEMEGLKKANQGISETNIFLEKKIDEFMETSMR